MKTGSARSGQILLLLKAPLTTECNSGNPSALVILQELKTNEITEESLQSTVAAIDQMFMKTRAAPVCQEPGHFVARCYAQNRTQSLLCSKEVKSFASCVESARVVRS